MLLSLIQDKIKDLELTILEAKKGNINLRKENGFDSELMEYEECLFLFKKLEKVLNIIKI